MNDSSADPLGESPLFIAFRTCFISILGIWIIAGNILSIVVTRRVPDLADSTKILMTSLAVADLTVGFLTVFSVVCSAMNYWPLGNVFCHAFAIVTVQAFFVSKLSLICLNIERYIAVSRPFKFPIWCSRRHVITSIVLSSIVCLCLLIATVFIFGVPVKYFQASALCFVTNTSTVLNILTLLFLDIIPVFLMMCMYYRIIKISREHEKRINQNDPNNRDKIRDKKALKTFVVVTLAVAVCLSPLLIVRIVESFTNTDVPHWLQFTTTSLYTANSICNVFIYCLFNRSYREQAKRLLKKSPFCWKTSVEPVDIPVQMSSAEAPN